MNLDSLISGLNFDQLAAVKHEGPGPIVVAGAPGAGKTKVIIGRVGYVVATGTPEDQILCMTFTRNAAREMNERLVAAGLSGGRCGTIHSVALEIVRTYKPSLLGEMDEHDSLRMVLKRHLQEFRKTGLSASRWAKNIDLEELWRFIGACKLSGITYVRGDPFGLNSRCGPNMRHVASQRAMSVGCHDNELIQVFEELEDRRAASGIYTFDDQVNHAYQLLLSDPQVRAEMQRRYLHVIVDETADSNPVQWGIAAMIAGNDDPSPHGARNLMVGGDSAQAIFKFQNATPEVLVALSQDKQTTVYRLPVNYRSVPEVCRVSYGLVKGKPWHLAGEIKPVRQANGHGNPPVSVVVYSHPGHEAQEVIRKCREYAEGHGGSYHDCVVLARIGVSLNDVELECIRHRIPYIKRASGSFTNATEVKDLLAYMRVACMVDPKGRWQRHIINTPFRFIGKDALVNAEHEASTHGCSLLEALQRYGSLRPRQTRSINQLVALLGDLNKMACQAEAAEAAATAATAAPVAASTPVADPEPLSEDPPEPPAAGDAPGPADMLATIVLRTDYVSSLRREEGLAYRAESREATIASLQRIARFFQSPLKFIAYIDALAVAMDQAKKAGIKRTEESDDASTALVLSSIHQCVAPETIVETEAGLWEIGELPWGRITVGTALGPRRANGKISYSDPVNGLRITTKGGYQISVTPDHGLMSWDGMQYIRTEARALSPGDWLRLKLSAAAEPAELATLPPLAQKPDVRAKLYHLPECCTADMAQLLGLLVGDGTLYHAGFRIIKADLDVIERAAELCYRLFGVKAHVSKVTASKAHSCEVNSTQLAAWLRRIDGLMPKQKAIPRCILRSPLDVQAAFLRGLFEDGTVNVRANGRLDHVAWFSCRERLAQLVQVMLLRFGCISRRFASRAGWRVDISGANGRRFGERIGFTCSRKQAKLMAAEVPAERMHSVPVSKEEGRSLRHTWRRQNSLLRGRLSRREASKEPTLRDRLQFHHDLIKRIEPCTLIPTCLEIPELGRFNQNGFDGCNSKGLQWDEVYLIDVTEGHLPHSRGDAEEELRLLYVAISRAKSVCEVSYSRDCSPSEFVTKLRHLNVPTRDLTGGSA